MMYRRIPFRTCMLGNLDAYSHRTWMTTAVTTSYRCHRTDVMWRSMTGKRADDVTKTSLSIRYYHPTRYERQSRYFSLKCNEIQDHNLGNHLEKKKKKKKGMHDPGLFQLLGLHEPPDFVTIAQHAISECRALRADLIQLQASGNESGVYFKILYGMDNISNKVCTVIDAAEFCRSVHVDKRWRDYANQAFSLIGEYISELNTDVELYSCLDFVSKNEARVVFTEEQMRMIQLLKAEFERDGIHLKDDERQRIAELHQHIAQLESAFTQNITMNAANNPLILPKNDIDNFIPPHFLSPLSDDDRSNKVNVPSDEAIVNTILRLCRNPHTRKEAFMNTNTSCSENLDVLHSLMAARHTLSTLLGFESYADKYLRDKMAQNQSRVGKFLDDIHSSIKKSIAIDMEKLQKAKQVIEGSSDLAPWDIPFYIHLIKSQEHSFHSSELAPYFSGEFLMFLDVILLHKIYHAMMLSPLLSKQSTSMY